MQGLAGIRRIVSKLLPLLLGTLNCPANLIWLHVGVAGSQSFAQPVKSSIKFLEFSWARRRSGVAGLHAADVLPMHLRGHCLHPIGAREGNFVITAFATVLATYDAQE